MRRIVFCIALLGMTLTFLAGSPAFATDGSSPNTDFYLHVATINDFRPDENAGKIIIVVHKSDNRRIPEYLEVFRQFSSHPTDIKPVLIFAGGKSNIAKVSTAGTYYGVHYSTPDGFYSIDRVEIMHYSHEYNNAPMPYSMFFDRGIAIHAATRGEYRMLGHEASHGCVRMRLRNAKALFDYVNSSPNDHADVIIEVIKDALSQRDS